MSKPTAIAHGIQAIPLPIPVATNIASKAKPTGWYNIPLTFLATYKAPFLTKSNTRDHSPFDIAPINFFAPS